jgi:hypothetical protein
LGPIGTRWDPLEPVGTRWDTLGPGLLPVPTPLYDFMWTDLPLAFITQREERLRENKENIPIQNSLGSKSRSASTERR